MPIPTRTTTLDASITPPPSLHYLGKRHFFECGDLTLSWEQEWYTAPFFLSSRSSYDRAASRGPVQPPLDIYQTVSACQRELGITAESTITTTTNSDGVAIWTTEISSSTTRSSLVTSSTSSSSSPSTPSAGGLSRSGSSSGTLSSSSPSTSSFLSISNTPTVTPSASPQALSTVNTCAGDWDWQASGVVANLGFGILIGALLWATWAILRSKMPGFYSPRTWSVPTDSRPSRSWSFLPFLIPFAYMPSLSSNAPLSSAALGLRTTFTGLKLAAISSLVALAAALPLILVNAPCIGETSPQNYLGGRLASLTDLSLLRLLNALDPSPDSDSTSNFLHLPIPLQQRALPSTIAPAISSARIRLIIILVLITVLSVGGGLFAITRSYASLSKYRKNFEEQICGGLSMVFVPSKYVPAWEGMTEEKLKIWFREHEVDSEGDQKELEVLGVFAIPDTTALQAKVEDRSRVLDKLELAETRYIRQRDLPDTGIGSLDPESRSSKATGPDVPSLRKSLGACNAEELTTGFDGQGREDEKTALVDPSSQTPLAQRPNTEETGTRFLEINRDSAQFGRRFKIGQRIRVDDQGVYVADSSPSTSEEDRRLSGEALMSATTISQSHGGSSTDSFHTPPQSATLPAGDSPTVPPPTAGLQSERNRHEEFDVEIVACRTEFKSLNTEIEVLQQDAFGAISSGRPSLGWVLVGRGVEWLSHSQVIEGRTKEDISWENVIRPRGEKTFIIKVVLVGFVLFLLSIPFLALTVATVPGFANYLSFLRPLRDSDGFWTGVVEALVPAFVLSHLLIVAVLIIERLSRNIQSISYCRQRALAYKATFWLLLFVATILPITIAALEFATQGLAGDIQSSRSVGDGATFFTWFAFCVLLNMAIIVPGLMLLQPLRLLRYLIRSRSAQTPRQKFRSRQAPEFKPSIALSPALIAVFYAATLLFIFPLLAIPVLILLYLSFIVVHHQLEYVYAPSKGFEAATLALWTIRRFGWVLALQPLVYGLIILSRREWEIGGISVGVAVTTVILSELLTAGRNPGPSRRKLSDSTKKSLHGISNAMSRPPNPAQRSRRTSGSSSLVLRPRQSTSSMLQRLTTMLPGLSRLPPNCPLPLETQIIDDLQSAEHASFTRPDLKDEERPWPQDRNRGLIYPPWMTCEVPIIWLPRGRYGISAVEVNDLAQNHGLKRLSTRRDGPKGEKRKVRGSKMSRGPH